MSDTNPSSSTSVTPAAPAKKPATRRTRPAGQARRKRKAKPTLKPTLKSTFKEAMSSSLHDTVAAIRASASERAGEVGPKVLAIASRKAASAGAALVKWGKKHPVKTAAAAATLLLAAKLLQSAMKKRAAKA